MLQGFFPEKLLEPESFVEILQRMRSHKDVFMKIFTRSHFFEITSLNFFRRVLDEKIDNNLIKYFKSSLKMFDYLILTRVAYFI